MNRSNSINRGNGDRRVCRPSNGAVDRQLPILNLRKNQSLPSTTRDDPVVLGKKGGQRNDNIGKDEKEFFALVVDVDDTPRHHPSHVPTPTTLEGLRSEDVQEVLFDTVPAAFEKLFSSGRNATNPAILGGCCWGCDPTVTPRRRVKRSILPKGLSTNSTTNRAVSDATALQQQWEVENAFNLHQAISSRRLLDKDYHHPLSKKDMSCQQSNG